MSKKKEKEQIDLMDPSKDFLEKLKAAQEFILWAKTEKIKQFKLNGLEFEVSELAYIDQLADVTQQSSQAKTQVTAAPVAGGELTNASDDEEALFWSTR